LADLAYVMRGKDYQLLDRPEVQARLQLPADQQTIHPETGTARQLYDCPELVIGPTGERCRVVIASHPAGTAKSPVGTAGEGLVCELFFTALPQAAFTGLMWWRCICIEALLKRCSLMKIWNRIPTAGAAMEPPDRNAGR
jgi:hypothetical protein